MTTRFLKSTVIGIGGSSKENRKFQFGSGSEHGEGWHVSENTILEESYLGPFLDLPLPLLSPSFTCRALTKAWCILRDAANVLASRCKKKQVRDLAEVEQLALTIRRAELERALMACGGFSEKEAQAVIDFFVCDPDDLTVMFNKGFWDAPLLSLDDDVLVLVLAPIVISSSVRRIENWLDRGGLSDRLSEARRGLRYEAWVRQQIVDAIAANALLPNSFCAANSIEQKTATDEQIDLIARVGSILIVAEIKCLLAPVESLEHFNYLNRLEQAGDQATRKAAWLSNRPDVVGGALQISEQEVKSLRVVPIVIVNQGVGFGLSVKGAHVVDFHFLKLYLSDNKYVSGSAFRSADATAVLNEETLYHSESEAASKFEQVMANPPPLKRYIEAATWVENRFPLSDGTDLLVSACVAGQKMNDEMVKLKSYLPPTQSKSQRS